MSVDPYRRCSLCGAEMPLDWHRRYCKFCGGGLLISLEEGEEIPASELPVWDGSEDLSSWTEKKELTVWHLEEPDDEPQITGLPDLRSAPPIALFAAGIATLGITTCIWIARRLSALNRRVRPSQRTSKSGVYLWLLCHLCAIALLAAAALGALPLADAAPLAAIYGTASFVMSRHYLNWLRSVVEDELMKNARQSDDRSFFARSPLLLWWAGPALLQLRLNRALRTRKGTG